MLSLIVAVSRNNVIGKDNGLIWHLPDDLKHFKELTTGKTIIMGRKTFDSLGRVLPNRKHVVITRSGIDVDNENVEVVQDVSDIQKYIDDDNENFLIGGATMYALLINKVSKMYITRINQDFVGDSYFPKFNEDEWEIVEKRKGPQDEKNNFDYDYITYVRKK